MNTKLFGLFIALLVCLPSLAQQKACGEGR